MFLNFKNVPKDFEANTQFYRKKHVIRDPTEVNVGYFGATALLESITRSGAIKTGFIEFFVRSSCVKNLGASRIPKRKLGPKQQKGQVSI